MGNFGFIMASLLIFTISSTALYMNRDKPW